MQLCRRCTVLSFVKGTYSASCTCLQTPLAVMLMLAMVPLAHPAHPAHPAMTPLLRERQPLQDEGNTKQQCI